MLTHRHLILSIVNISITIIVVIITIIDVIFQGFAAVAKKVLSQKTGGDRN